MRKGMSVRVVFGRTGPHRGIARVVSYVPGARLVSDFHRIHTKIVPYEATY